MGPLLQSHKCTWDHHGVVVVRTQVLFWLQVNGRWCNVFECSLLLQNGCQWLDWTGASHSWCPLHLGGTGSDLMLHFLSTLQTHRTDAGVAVSLSLRGGLSTKELSSLKDFTLQRGEREREGVWQTKHTPKTRKKKTLEIYCLALTDRINPPSCSARST